MSIFNKKEKKDDMSFDRVSILNANDNNKKEEKKTSTALVPERVFGDENEIDNITLITEYLYGKKDLTADLKKLVERKTERQRIAFNFISSNSVASMAELQDYIQRCQMMLFRPERLQIMNDEEIAKSMFAAMALFEKESMFALKVADMNKDFTPSPDKQSKLGEAIANLPKDVLEAMIKQIKNK